MVGLTKIQCQGGKMHQNSGVIILNFGYIRTEMYQVFGVQENFNVIGPEEMSILV